MRSKAAMSITQVLEKSVVVFSQNYLPLCRVNIKRAVVLLVTQKAEPLDITTESGWHINSPNLIVYVPKHIRLIISSRERMWKVPPVNRRGILRRDRNSCQYCGSNKNLTLDHVIPRSRNGRHTWENVVAACSECNCRKSNRTPKEAGMPLRTKPKSPVHPTVSFAEQFWKGVVQANLE
jgi:5-methylcytosine-specific restriction endonuclease McrA